MVTQGPSLMGALYNSIMVSRFTRTSEDILDNYIETFQCLHLEMAHVTFPHSPLARICHRTLPAARSLGNVVNQWKMW